MCGASNVIKQDVGKSERRDIGPALEMIKTALEAAERPAVAFSGGKDSTAVAELVRRVDDSIPLFFCNTGVEWPQTVKHCRRMGQSRPYTELKPRDNLTFWNIVEREGWPGLKSKAKRHGNACCFFLKERPMLDHVKQTGIDVIFTGLTAAESRLRWMVFKRLGPYYYAKTWKTWKCHPIHDWTEGEVWHFIRENDLKYNPIYDPPINAKRCGCMPCTAYLSWKERLGNENPAMLRHVLRKKEQQTFLDEFGGCDGSGGG